MSFFFQLFCFFFFIFIFFLLIFRSILIGDKRWAELNSSLQGVARIFLSLSFSFFPHQRYPSESRQRFRAPSHQDSNPCSHHLCHAEPLPNLASVAVCRLIPILILIYLSSSRFSDLCFKYTFLSNPDLVNLQSKWGAFENWFSSFDSIYFFVSD